MKPVINGRFTTRPVTGVERYSREIVERLESGVRLVTPEKYSAGIRGQFWEQFILPGAIQPGERLWAPANTGPLTVANQVLTLHDIAPLEHPEWFNPLFALWYQYLIPRLVKSVHGVAVPSRYVRDRVIGRFSLSADRVIVVPGGVDTARFSPLAPHPLTRIPERYILFVGSLQPRKNIGALLKAWQTIRGGNPEVILLIAGKPGRAFRKVALPYESERVIFTGYFPDSDLPGLYARASLLVLPSLEEGFGLTALEAMACGIPVIASRAGALPELIGDAGLLFEPADSATLASHIHKCLNDRALSTYLGEQGRQRARQFSWQDSADRVWGIINHDV